MISALFEAPDLGGSSSLKSFIVFGFHMATEPFHPVTFVYFILFLFQAVGEQWNPVHRMLIRDFAGGGFPAVS